MDRDHAPAVEPSTTSTIGVPDAQRRGSLRDGLRGERRLAPGLSLRRQPVTCSTLHDLELA
jgi:hypothetical protein